MINVGGEIGALVLNSASVRSGLEVQIESLSDPTFHTHVYVLPRQIEDQVTYAAVFPSLLAGDYLVREPDGTEGRRVRVVGGEVTQEGWT